MDRPHRDSRQQNGIMLRGLSQPTFATKSANRRHRKAWAWPGQRRTGWTTLARSGTFALVGVTDRSPGTVAQGFKPVLPVAVENLVAGLARYAELPADFGHGLPIQKPGDKAQALFHHRTRFPRHEVPAWMFDRTACPDPGSWQLNRMSASRHLRRSPRLLDLRLKAQTPSAVPLSGVSGDSRDKNRGETHVTRDENLREPTQLLQLRKTRRVESDISTIHSKPFH
jgi:hypothetical protein